MLAILSIYNYDSAKLIKFYLIFSYLGGAINIFLKRHNKLHLLKYFSSLMLILSGLYFSYDAYND